MKAVKLHVTWSRCGRKYFQRLQILQKGKSDYALTFMYILLAFIHVHVCTFMAHSN